MVLDQGAQIFEFYFPSRWNLRKNSIYREFIGRLLIHKQTDIY